MSAKRKDTEKTEIPKPKICYPPIPDEMIARLIARYSIPVQNIPDESTAALWDAVADLKGWMVKKGKSPTDPNGMRYASWREIKGMLDAAVNANDSAAFDTLAKAWLKWEMAPSRRHMKPTKQSARNPWDKENETKKQWLADTIEALVPALPTNPAHSPKKIEFIEAIEDLQRKFRFDKSERAPTRLELEKRTSLKKNKVYEWVKEMGLSDLLSRAQRPKKRDK